MININLKYFTDKDDNYIIYRKFTDSTPHQYIQSSFFYVHDTILPTNDTNAIESTFDDLAKKCIEKHMEKFSNCSEDDFSYIKIVGNFIDIDKTNPIFTKHILNKSDIDKFNTQYTFGMKIESDYPVTLKSFFKNPMLIIKTLVRTVMAQIDQYQ